MNHIFLGAIVISSITSAFSQVVMKDSIPAAKPDSLYSQNAKKVITIDTYSNRFNPRKAILYSAILPGLGQVYNKKYWKVPLVYGGLVSFILVVDFYNSQGNKLRNDLFDLLDGKTSAPNVSPLGFSETQLRNRIDLAQRQRDYFLIITGFFYLLQLVDAHVDAHLKEFDLNPKLKVKIEPMIESNYYTGTSSGIAIRLRF